MASTLWVRKNDIMNSTIFAFKIHTKKKSPFKGFVDYI
jgi:hypothetical protein